MSIQAKQDEIIAEFSSFNSPVDRYDHIIKIAKELPIIEKQYKNEDCLIKGCQSKVWLHSEFNNNIVAFTADSDTVITKGIIALLIRVLSGHTPKEIFESDLYFIDKIGMNKLFSPIRNNGLLEMVKQIKLYSKQYMG
jgi:cysteine desulfuration protein SufE